MVTKKYGGFLVKSKNISKDCLLWNMIASLLFGFQSVILLMVLTRTVGLIDSGIFTIAYANASLFLFVGKYGVRNYQVSDVQNEHTFGDYYCARWISVTAMLIAAIVYIVYSAVSNGYTLEKSLIVFFMCLFKVPDAIEDVFFGEYQRKGRLDIAAKAMAIRLALAIIIFAVLVTVTQNLLFSLIADTIISFGIMAVFLKWTAGSFDMDFQWKKGSVWLILRDCFPLFAGTFLAQYISNASKYAIDAQLSDELQACYGFIAMPVFVIGLLNNVVFSPIIYRMAEYWNQRKLKAFLKRFMVQVCIVIGLTFCCIIGAYLLGIPVLSILYNTELHEYKKELLILLLGGGFLALSGLLNTMITIMRCQYPLLMGYTVVSLIALVCSEKIVALYGMTGAAWLYTALMGMLCVIFVVIFIIVFIRKGFMIKRR